MKFIYFILFFSFFNNIYSEESLDNTYQINKETKVSFIIPFNNFSITDKVTNKTSLEDLKNIKFERFEIFSGFQPYKYYIKKIRFSNVLEKPVTLTIRQNNFHLNTEFFVTSKNLNKSYVNSPSFNFNNASLVSPNSTNFEDLELRNFSFTVEPNESVDFYYKFQSPNKTRIFSNQIRFAQLEKFQESRRFGLWLEGIILGTIFALIIFTFYSYSQIKDRTTFYFGAWLTSAFFAVISQDSHDGSRLFEFFVDPNFSIWMTPIKRYLIDLFSYSQAMIFVIFARKFIDLKKYHPTAFRVTNIYLGWYLVHFIVFQQFNIDIGLKTIWYSLIFSTFLILSIIFICAILRLKNGMELGKFFIIGMLPYFVFRLFFLLTILGVQSPFSYLPDSGIKYFLNSQAVTQAVGLFLEAIFMSLVLAKRTKFLQDNLNENIQKQAVEAEKQQVVLEETVKERTSELEEKSTALEGVSNQLAKYIPPQIHDALFAGKYDTEIKTQRRKLTVFFSDIKNFTSTSENLQPEDLTKYLNEYFSEMTKIAIDHGATIDKYIGDAMMVFFGDPETKGEREDARACVEMALKMQERMGQLREKWLNEGFADPFEVRIGINTGYCNVGNFGSDQRLTYTIIGGEVNVAARLESAAQANGILMSYETYAHVQDMVEVEQKEAIKMKGINREIKIYAVEGRKEVVKTKAKVTKAKKPTKKELTKIEKLEKELSILKDRLNKLES